MSLKAERRRAILKESPLDLDGESTDKLERLWDELEEFVVKDLGDGFQLRDVYSLIVAVMNGLEFRFPDTTGKSLKSYAIFIVEKIVLELVAAGVIPSEISMLLRFVPIGTVVDLLSNVTKNVPFINRLGASPDVGDKEWIRRNWVALDRK
jgi:hypothetical protein